jgi:hypothetical protein
MACGRLTRFFVPGTRLRYRAATVRERLVVLPDNRLLTRPALCRTHGFATQSRDR